MKKIYFALFVCLINLSINATSYTITTVGFAYSPASLTVTVGDVVTIIGSSMHPLAQVDATVWAASGTSTLVGGWGVQTVAYTFTVSAPGSTYFVCQNHVASNGMKGQITANAPARIKENSSNLTTLDLFPNPISSKITINFALTGTSDVTAKLYNMLGQEVAVLIPDTKLSEQNYSYVVDLPANLPNGAYFAAITSNERRVTKKIVINK